MILWAEGAVLLLRSLFTEGREKRSERENFIRKLFLGAGTLSSR